MLRRWMTTLGIMAGLLTPALVSAQYLLGTPLGAQTPVTSGWLGFAVAAALAGDTPWVAAGALSRNVTVFRADQPEGPLLRRQTLTSEFSPADNFGFAVAVSAHPTGWIAVGAFTDSAGPMNAGRVDVFGLDGSGVHQRISRLFPPVQVLAGNFGAAVALDDELLAVGEPKAQRPGDNLEVGAVHLYRFQGAGWQLQRTLYGDEPFARFGQSVAVQGGTLAVGIILADTPGGADAGAVHFFVETSPTTWMSQGVVVASDGQVNDRLGTAVTLSGDFAVSGAGTDDKVAGIDAGSAYVFRRVAGSWSEQVKLRSGQAQTQEHFGQSVSLRGDELLVGAYCVVETGCLGTGAAYVFQRQGNVWPLQQRLAPTGSESQRFGHGVSHAGRRGAVVGAYLADAGGPADQGLVYPLLPPADRLLVNGFENAAQPGP